MAISEVFEDYDGFCELIAEKAQSYGAKLHASNVKQSKVLRIALETIADNEGMLNEALKAEIIELRATAIEAVARAKEAENSEFNMRNKLRRACNERDVALMNYEKLECSVVEHMNNFETAEARDRVRLATFYSKNIPDHHKGNKGYIMEFGAILAGGHIQASPDKGKEVC